MTDLIEQMKASLEGVTDGPWEACPSIPADGFEGYWLRARQSFAGAERGFRIIDLGSINGPQYGEQEANARFIAAARTLLPEAIKEIEELRSRVESAEARCHTLESKELQALRQRDAAEAKLAKAVEAFHRQADNMAFVLNKMSVPDQWYEKFLRELEADRATLAEIESPSNGN